MKIFLFLLTTMSLITYPITAKSNSFVYLNDQLTNITDPTFPSFTIDPSVNIYKRVEGNGGGFVEEGDSQEGEETKTYQFDLTSHGLTKSNFFKYYSSTMQVTDFWGKAASAWDNNHVEEYKDPFSINISSDGDYEIFKWRKNGGSMTVQCEGKLKWSWSGNTIMFTFIARSSSWHHDFGGYDADAKTWLQVNEMKFTAKGQGENSWENKIRKKLETEITFSSDYSGSLEDQQNIYDPNGKNNDLTTIMTNNLKSIFGNEYSIWKPFIQPFSFSDNERKITTVIRFHRLSTGNLVE